MAVRRLHDHVLDVDADAELEPRRRRLRELREAPLTSRPTDGLDGAAELHEERIPDDLKQQTLVLGDLRFQEVLPERFPPEGRPHVIELHELGESRHVREHHGGETALHLGAITGQWRCSRKSGPAFGTGSLGIRSLDGPWGVSPGWMFPPALDSPVRAGFAPSDAPGSAVPGG